MINLPRATMSNLEEKFERLMKVVEEERTLRKKAEADLAAAKQAANLAAATAATQLANANAVAAAATVNPKKPKMSLPSKFDGTRGEKAKAWIEPAEPTGTTVDAFALASDPRENCGSSTIEAATEDG
ncbi:hypothetical protein KEM48_007866 [Puccinia striiformis f. sp. tritici PST-130]|nr:hypothetical protein KEM48_007866 [Puccinia striiformis f. sp. tritici PST-130]